MSIAQDTQLSDDRLDELRAYFLNLRHSKAVRQVIQTADAGKYCPYEDFLGVYRKAQAPGCMH